MLIINDDLYYYAISYIIEWLDTNPNFSKLKSSNIISAYLSVTISGRFGCTVIKSLEILSLFISFSSEIFSLFGSNNPEKTFFHMTLYKSLSYKSPRTYGCEIFIVRLSNPSDIISMALLPIWVEFRLLSITIPLNVLFGWFYSLIPSKIDALIS